MVDLEVVKIMEPKALFYIQAEPRFVMNSLENMAAVKNLGASFIDLTSVLNPRVRDSVKLASYTPLVATPTVFYGIRVLGNKRFFNSLSHASQVILICKGGLYVLEEDASLEAALIWLDGLLTGETIPFLSV